MHFNIECEKEVDGRWIAEIPQLSGVLCYGQTAEEAIMKSQILALRTIAERIENAELTPTAISISLPIAA